MRRGILKSVAILGISLGLSKAKASNNFEIYQLDIDSEEMLEKFEKLKAQNIIQESGVVGIYTFNKSLIHKLYASSDSKSEVQRKLEEVFGEDVDIQVVGAFISEIGTNDGGWPSI